MNTPKLTFELPVLFALIEKLIEESFTAVKDVDTPFLLMLNASFCPHPNPYPSAANVWDTATNINMNATANLFFMSMIVIMRIFFVNIYEAILLLINR